MKDNSAGTNPFEHVHTPRRVEMDLYDKLPPAVRAQLANAPVKWSAATCANLLAVYSEEDVLYSVEHQNKEIMATPLTEVYISAASFR